MHADRRLPVFDSENNFGSFVECYLCVETRLQCAVRRTAEYSRRVLAAAECSGAPAELTA